MPHTTSTTLEKKFKWTTLDPCFSKPTNQHTALGIIFKIYNFNFKHEQEPGRTLASEELSVRDGYMRGTGERHQMDLISESHFNRSFFLHTKQDTDVLRRQLCCVNNKIINFSLAQIKCFIIFV